MLDHNKSLYILLLLCSIKWNSSQYEIFLYLQCVLYDGTTSCWVIVKGKAPLAILDEIKTKGLIRKMRIKFKNFGTDADCIRINNNSSVEIITAVGS